MLFCIKLFTWITNLPKKEMNSFKALYSFFYLCLPTANNRNRLYFTYIPFLNDLSLNLRFFMWRWTKVNSLMKRFLGRTCDSSMIISWSHLQHDHEGIAQSRVILCHRQLQRHHQSQIHWYYNLGYLWSEVFPKES